MTLTTFQKSFRISSREIGRNTEWIRNNEGTDDPKKGKICFPSKFEIFLWFNISEQLITIKL